MDSKHAAIVYFLASTYSSVAFVFMLDSFLVFVLYFEGVFFFRVVVCSSSPRSSAAALDV